MMKENLRVEGFEVGRERVRRLMKVLGLRVKRRRKYRTTTDSRHDYPVAQNI